MDDMKGIRLYALMVYLVTNAVMLDMDIYVDNYIGEYSTDNNTLVINNMV
jgi:hypothetical protein